MLVHPLGSFTGGTRQVWLKTLPCWLCGLIFATPQLFIFVQVEEPPHPGTVRTTLVCKSDGYTAEWQRKAYFTFLTAYILVVPTIIMVYCYASIVRVIWLQSRRSGSASSKLLRKILGRFLIVGQPLTISEKTLTPYIISLYLLIHDLTTTSHNNIQHDAK